jgi:2,3,4,5-tetrahydropyridine-2,6-dicarboxylate N-succinyltransferase
VLEIVERLNNGEVRVCEQIEGVWRVNKGVKQAILSLFQFASPCTGYAFKAEDVLAARPAPKDEAPDLNGELQQSFVIDQTESTATFAYPAKPKSQQQDLGKTFVPSFQTYDKIPMKFASWHKKDFASAKIRVSHGAIVRYGAFLSENVVLMNCFVNIGAYIGRDTMVDSFATIGSCAQIGARCHIASGSVIGGVLEPINAVPVVIEDDCLIGANAAIVEGVVVRRGATIAMGTRIGASTKIIDRQTKCEFSGEIPEGAIVVPGAYESEGLSIYCAVIVGYRAPGESGIVGVGIAPEPELNGGEGVNGCGDADDCTDGNYDNGGNCGGGCGGNDSGSCEGGNCDCDAICEDCSCDDRCEVCESSENRDGCEFCSGGDTKSESKDSVTGINQLLR